MGKIINFYFKINEKIKIEEERRKAAEEKMKEMIRQHEKKLFFIKRLEEINPLEHSVNYNLVFEGWIPCATIPINQNYFINRKRIISYIGNSGIKEEREVSNYTEDPCIVFYKKEKFDK